MQTAEQDVEVRTQSPGAGPRQPHDFGGFETVGASGSFHWRGRPDEQNRLWFAHWRRLQQPEPQ